MTAKTTLDLSSLTDIEIKAAIADIAKLVVDDTLKIQSGQADNVTRAVVTKVNYSGKNDALLNDLKYAFVCCFINGFKWVDKDDLPMAIGKAKFGLTIKSGGKKNRSMKGFTLGAIFGAFPDVAAHCIVACDGFFKSNAVGGHYFSAETAMLVYPGVSRLLLTSVMAEDERTEIAVGIVFAQCGYISSRALATAGSKTAPSADKIRAARAKAVQYTKQAGQFKQNEKLKVLTDTKMDGLVQRARDLGKKYKDMDTWPTDAAAMLALNVTEKLFLKA